MTSYSDFLKFLGDTTEFWEHIQIDMFCMNRTAVNNLFSELKTVILKLLESKPPPPLSKRYLQNWLVFLL